MLLEEGILSTTQKVVHFNEMETEVQKCGPIPVHETGGLPGSSGKM